MFLHRWRKEMDIAERRASGGFIIRMITADKNGNDIFIIDLSGNTSYFIWRNPQHICAWTKPEGKEAGFNLFQDKTRKNESVGEESMVENGHNTYVPNTNNEWILNNTYPYRHPQHKQTLYLYYIPSKRKVVLGQFPEPGQFRGEWRCDLHPRCDRQGNRVFFDSTHEGEKRQLFMIGIKKFLT